MPAVTQDPLDLLKRLLALLPAEATASPSPAIRQVLRRLIDLAPRTARKPRQRTLFEAINVLNRENPHSDYLAWLLDPAGPLDDCWLLRRLFRHIAGDHDWPGTPVVEREIAVSTGRADIVISWDDFKIVIENKVWSLEGHHQIVRYLDGFEINDSSEGCVVFLTPEGRQPTGVPADRRPCVHTLSYVDLAGMIEEGLASGLQQTQRGYVLADELHKCIQRLLNVKDPMKKPCFTEATSLLMAHAKGLQMLMDQAAEQTADFIEWMYSQLEERVKPMLGDGAVKEGLKSGVLFRLPQWGMAGVIYGIGFKVYSDPRKRLISQHSYEPWVGVGICLPDGTEDTPECRAVMERLLPVLREAWPHTGDLKRETSWPLYRYMPIVGGDFDHWHEAVETVLKEMAEKLTPAIDRLSKPSRPTAEDEAAATAAGPE